MCVWAGWLVVVCSGTAKLQFITTDVVFDFGCQTGACVSLPPPPVQSSTGGGGGGGSTGPFIPTPCSLFHPCANGGTCTVVHTNEYHCECTNEYAGQNCTDTRGGGGGGSGLSPAATVGIVFGVLTLGFIGAGVWYCYHQQREKEAHLRSQFSSQLTSAVNSNASAVDAVTSNPHSHTSSNPHSAIISVGSGTVSYQAIKE